MHFWDIKERPPGVTSAEMTDRKITVKYYDTTYKADRYDEIVSQLNVFVTAEDADVGKGKRTRIVAVQDPPPPSKLSGYIRKSPIITVTSERELTPNKRVKNVESEQKPKIIPGKIVSPAGDAKVLRRSKISIDPATLQERFDNTGVHDLVALLYPSYGDRVPFRTFRYVDRNIKRGLLHTVYNYVRPPKFGKEDTCVDRPGPVISLAQLCELLEVCPTTRGEMADRALMPLCAPLLRTPDCVGDALVEVVRTYLAERGFETATLRDSKRGTGTGAGAGAGGGAGAASGRIRVLDPDSEDEISDGVTSTEASRDLPRGLSIPLSYEHFSLALDLAFEKLGGREAFENRKGVKGLEYVVNGTPR